MIVLLSGGRCKKKKGVPHSVTLLEVSVRVHMPSEDNILVASMPLKIFFRIIRHGFWNFMISLVRGVSNIQNTWSLFGSRRF